MVQFYQREGAQVEKLNRLWNKWCKFDYTFWWENNQINNKLINKFWSILKPNKKSKQILDLNAKTKAINLLEQDIHYPCKLGWGKIHLKREQKHK